MKVVILGATGLLGQQVVREAILASHSVLAIVRNPGKFKEIFKDIQVSCGCTFSAEPGNIFDPASLKPHFVGADVVISCLGTKTFKDFWGCTFYSQSMAAILKAMEGAGVQRIIKTGGWGLAAHPDTPKYVEWLVRPLLMYSVAKNHTLAEKMLEDSPEIQYTIIRPPGMNDHPVLDKEVVKVMDAQFISGCSMYMPAQIVARFFISCMSDKSMLRKSVAIGIMK